MVCLSGAEAKPPERFTAINATPKTIEKDEGRYYPWKGNTFISVTTVLKQGIPKPGLDKWLRDQIAKQAHRDSALLAGMTQLEALKHLSGGESTRFDASNLGSNVHAYADRSARGADAPISEAVSPFAVQFEQFRQDFNPTFLHTEATVFNREHQYAGTLDAIVEIDGVTYVMDYKTGKRVYPEVALQLSAYANAEFIGGPEGTEQPLPRCHRGLVLHIRPDHYELRPVVIGTGVFDAFLAALDVVRWSTVTSTYVIGRPLNETSNRGQQGLPLSV